MVLLCAIRWSCIAILWVSLVSLAAISLYVASQRVFIVVSVYFVIDSVRKLLDTAWYKLFFIQSKEKAYLPIKQYLSQHHVYTFEYCQDFPKKKNYF
jgi:hypothetical protein